MSILLISDIHSNYEDLNKISCSSKDILIILGDMLGLIDWEDMTGILTDIVGIEKLGKMLHDAVVEGAESITKLRDMFFESEGKYYEETRKASEKSYERIAKALEKLPCRILIIYGNSDLPDYSRVFFEQTKNIKEAKGLINIDGNDFGFISGSLISRFKMPMEMNEDYFKRELEELKGADYLCTHIPPDIMKARFDVVAKRPQDGGESILKWILEEEPRIHYHGHVHTPESNVLKKGRTLIVNAGYFKRRNDIICHETYADEWKRVFGFG